MAWYFYINNMYDIFAHTKLHIDSQTNIFYFEHIQSTELSAQLWMKNELQFNWLSNTDKYLCFIFMYGILERVSNNKHNILELAYINFIKNVYLLLNDCYVNLFLIYSIFYIIWDVFLSPFHVNYCLLHNIC